MTTTYELYTNENGTPKAVEGKAPAIIERVEALETDVTGLATKNELQTGLAGKADRTYVDTGLATKNELQTGLAGKADRTYVDAGLAEKQPVGDYATTEALTTGLDSKLGKTEKASSATVADTANSVAWVNVTGKPTIPSSPTIYVVDAQKTSSSWYRKWSNNVIEQGGVVTNRDIGDAVNVSFLVPFTSTDFAIMVNATNITETKNRMYTNFIQVTTSSFTVFKSRCSDGWNKYTDVKVDWYAISSY